MQFLSGNTGNVRRFSLDKGRQLLVIGMVFRLVVVRFFGREEGFPASHRYHVPLGNKRFAAEVENDFRSVVLVGREELRQIASGNKTVDVFLLVAEFRPVASIGNRDNPVVRRDFFVVEGRALDAGIGH